MKKPLYIPTDKDLSEMEKIKGRNDTNFVNVDGYITAKVVEKLINEGRFLRNADKFVLEIPEVVNALCWVYPQEVINADYAKYDVDLCLKLLSKVSDKSIYSIDNLAPFAPSVNSNHTVIKNTIRLLSEKLPENPEYRFVYRPNELLDSIFSLDYQKFASLTQSYDVIKGLTSIEPAYVLNFDEKTIVPELDNPTESIIINRKGMLLNEGLNTYLKAYNICSYRNVPSDKAKIKRLIKYLHD